MRARLSSAGRAGVALALLVLALFRDLVFGGRVLFDRDVYFMWFGQVEVFRQCIRTGSWPVWDRTMAFGQPMLANPGVETFYPWTWLSLFIDSWSFFTVFAVGHLFVSGIGFFLLVRRFRIGPIAAAAAAAVWITSGPMMSFVNLWHHFAGAALIPWVLLAADVALSGPVGRGVLVWGAMSGLQLLAGSADMCILTTLPAAALVLRRVAWRRTAWRANAAVLATLAGAAVLAGALAAAQWFPTMALASSSLRMGRLAESMRTSWSVHPRALLGLALPVFPRELPLGGEPEFAVEAYPFVASLYLGLTSIPLVLAAFGGARRRPAWICGAAVLAALLLALGRHTILYSLVTRLLPPLGSLRYPSKVMVLVAFGWALLVALGLERLQADDGRSRRRAAVVALGMAVLAAVLAHGAHTSLAAILAPASTRLVAAAVLASLLAALAWWGRGRGASPAIAAVLGVLAVADLFVAHESLNATVARASVTRPPDVVRAVLTSPAPRRIFAFDYYDIVGKTYRRPSSGRVLALRDARSGTFDAYRELGNPAVARAWGVSGSFDNDAFGLYPGYLVQLVMMFRVWEDTPAFLRALQVGHVGHVVAVHTEGLEALKPEAVFPGSFAAPIRLYEVPEPLPRCRVVAAGPVAVNERQQFTIMADPRFDPAVEVLLPPGTVSPADGGPPVRGSCRIVDFRHDRGRFEVELDAPGYVVLADTYAPEWRATLDGRPVDVVRGNIAFQAVPAPAGRHVLELVYRPPSLILGLWVSGLAFLVLAGGGLAHLAAARRGWPARDTISAVSTREP